MIASLLFLLACGSERWNVKTAKDAAATQIKWLGHCNCGRARFMVVGFINSLLNSLGG